MFEVAIFPSSSSVTFLRPFKQAGNLHRFPSKWAHIGKKSAS